MVNEITKVELFGENNGGQQVRYTIADGTSVSKGQPLSLSDPRTVVATTGVGAAAAGIAAEDHFANEGVTSISVWQQGIFEAKASGAIGVGEPIYFVENNYVATTAGLLNSSASFAFVAGRAIEAADDEEIINIRLNL